MTATTSIKPTRPIPKVLPTTIDLGDTDVIRVSIIFEVFLELLMQILDLHNRR